MEETQQLLLPDADDVESASVAASRGEAHATASESSRTSLLKNNPELRKIVVALCLTFGFMIVEAVGGYLTGSLAIVTDAAHMFSDSTSFFISFMAILIASKKPNKHFTYGYQRFEIVGALASVLLIWIITIFLVIEAATRVRDIIQGNDTDKIDGKMMTIIAIIALVVNITLMYVLGHHHHGHDHGHDHGHGHGHGHDHGHDHGHGHGHDHGHDHDHDDHHHDHDHDGHHDDHDHHNDNSESNINVRAAYIHALGDLLQSIGVCIAGIVIWVKPSWQIVDPVCTFIFAVLVLLTTGNILNQSVGVLLERVPKHIDMDSIKGQVLSLPNVEDIHDIHIWSITAGSCLGTAHVIVDVDTIVEGVAILEKVSAIFEKGKVHHVTLQLENSASGKCPTHICY